MSSREPTPLRVVIAEDNDDHALLIQLSLERASLRPVTIARARNGDEALEVMDRERPDLMLLDLRMPGRDGHEVLEYLKGHPELRAIPVAVLTSSDRDDDLAKSYGLGGNHFLTKPDNPAKLEVQLKRLLNNLQDLQSVSRGSGGMDATGHTAAGPEALARRQWIPYLVVAAVLALLFVFARSLGLV